MNRYALIKIRKTIRKPGVLRLELWDDGLEVVGSPFDSDDQAGFIDGVFTPEEICPLFPHLILTDNRA